MNNKVLISLLALTFSQAALAEQPGSANHASKASKHSALAAAHSTVATSKVASAAVAIPLQVAGSAGKVSTAAGNKLMESATKTEVLEVTDKTITVDPAPAQAMKATQKKKL